MKEYIVIIFLPYPSPTLHTDVTLAENFFIVLTVDEMLNYEAMLQMMKFPERVYHLLPKVCRV